MLDPRPAILDGGLERVHYSLVQQFPLRAQALLAERVHYSLVQQFPLRAQALLAYHRIICDASIRFPPSSWLRYDRRFRATAAANKSTRWDRKRNDLWLECFTQPTVSQPPSTKARRPCTYCGNLYHYPENCPTNPFRAFRAVGSTGRRQPPLPPTSTRPNKPGNAPQKNPVAILDAPPLRFSCRDFNKGACHRQTCRFHVCAKCGDSAHGERHCPTLR